MGISVISPPASGSATALPGTSTTSAPATEGQPGEFASLLIGEMQNLLAQAPDKSVRTLVQDLKTSAKTLGQPPETSVRILAQGLEMSAWPLSQEGQGESSKNADSESQEMPVILVDPAMIAALIGNAQLQQDIPVRNTNSLLPTDGNAEAHVSAVGLVISDESATSNSDLNARGTEKALATEVFKLEPLGKLPPSGNAAAEVTTGSQRQEAANIAVETKNLESLKAGGDLPNTAKIAGDSTAAEETQSIPSNVLGPVIAGRTSSSALASTHQTQISTDLRESTWPQHFSEKIVWLTKSDQQSAQININPPQLGPVQITLNMSGDQATLAFASPHPEVRQAIENAMPQLKEMLLSAGINLGQSNVGANLSQQSPDNPFQTANGNRSTSENAILPANADMANTGSSPVLQRGRGLVDLFA